jgi:hypothetical protein
VQGLYLDFIAGSPGGRAAIERQQIKVVVVSSGSAPERLVSSDRSFRRAEIIGNTDIYLRRR